MHANRHALPALQANRKATEVVLAGWVEAPLFRRASSRTYEPEDFEREFASHAAAR